MSPSSARVTAIYRYPVKGLSPEPISRVPLSVGATLPADRIYAIENGPSGFDPAAPAFFPKTRFLMLMRNERLARLATRLDVDTHRLTVSENGRLVAEGDLRSAAGRTAIEDFFGRYCADELNGPVKILTAPDHSFSDVGRKVVSIINLGSVAALADCVGAPVHPLRFRGNVYVEGWPAWHELDLVDREITLGAARLRIVKRTRRCAATNVDPQTGQRDLAIPATLLESFGHADCGIYGEVIAEGDVAIGDKAVVLPD
jgi:uncharacterized protein